MLVSKKEPFFRNACASQDKEKKMLLAVHLSYRMNVLITHGFSQLRTTPGRGSQKILRVWKEASWLITEHSTPKSLSPPPTEVTLGKPLDLSVFFVIPLPPSSHSLFLESLPWFLLQVSNFYKMSFCEAFWFVWSQISFFLIHTSLF